MVFKYHKKFTYLCSVNMVTDVYKYLALKIVNQGANDCFWQLFFECMNFANLSHWSSTKLRNLLYPIYLLYTKTYFIPSFYCIQNHTSCHHSIVYKTYFTPIILLYFIQSFYCIHYQFYPTILLHTEPYFIPSIYCTQNNICQATHGGNLNQQYLKLK